MRRAGESAEGRYRLRSQKNGQSWLVTGKRFFAHYGLMIDKARTFDAEAYDGGIVGFKLAGGAKHGLDRTRIGLERGRSWCRSFFGVPGMGTG